MLRKRNIDLSAGVLIRMGVVGARVPATFPISSRCSSDE